MDKLDTVFLDAQVITMDENMPFARAIGVKDGEIHYLGSTEDLPLAPSTKVISLNGSTILPGFIDSHTHFMQTGLGLTGVDLREAASKEELLAKISRAVQTKAPGELVRGWGYDDSVFPGKEPPTMGELDQAAPDNPVWLSRIDSHSCAVNGKCWDLIGLAPELEGIERNGSGQVTGILRAKANSAARKEMAGLVDARMRLEALEAAEKLAFRAGLTSVCALEGGELFGDADVLFLLEHRQERKLRFTIYNQSTDVEKVQKLGLKQIGGCILIDGAFGSRTAALFEPYADAPGEKGLLYFPDQALQDFIREAHCAGLQIATHVIGDRAIEQLLQAYEKVLAEFPRSDHRHRLEHMELANDEQIFRMKKLGLIASVQPAFEYFWGGGEKMYASRLGEERAGQTNRLRRLLAAGLRPVGGSDSDVTPMEPLLGVHSAVNHPNSSQRIPVREALRMFTVDAAYATFHEEVKGTLTPGKLADLVVLGENPLTVSPQRLKDIQVIMTVIGGEIVYQV